MDIICYLCEKGCRIRAVDKNHLVGAECKKGEEFAVSELTAPKRVLATTMRTSLPEYPVVPVKTDGVIDKALLFDVVKALNEITVNEYKNLGEVVVKNVLNTGVNVVTTTNMWRK